MEDNTKTLRSNLAQGWGFFSTNFVLKPKKRGPKPKPKPEKDQVVLKRKPGRKPKPKAGKQLNKKRGKPGPKPRLRPDIGEKKKIKQKPGPKPKGKQNNCQRGHLQKIKRKPGPKPRPKPEDGQQRKIKRKPGPKPRPKQDEGQRQKTKLKPGPKPRSKPEAEQHQKIKKKSQRKQKETMNRKNYSRGLAKEIMTKAVPEYNLRCSVEKGKIDTKLLAHLSDKYKIPRKPLRNRIKKGVDVFVGQGPATELTEEEEKTLVLWCSMRFLNECPVTKEVLQAEARRISGNRFLASRNWYKLFGKRHPELDFEKKPEEFTAKRKAAKTVRAVTQHFEESFRAIKLVEELNGGSLEAFQEANLDEKPVKSNDQLPRRVIGLSKSEKDCHFKALGDGNSFTTVEVIFADGTCLPTMYLFKGKRFPANFHLL